MCAPCQFVLATAKCKPTQLDGTLEAKMRFSPRFSLTVASTIRFSSAPQCLLQRRREPFNRFAPGDVFEVVKQLPGSSEPEYHIKSGL